MSREQSPGVNGAAGYSDPYLETCEERTCAFERALTRAGDSGGIEARAEAVLSGLRLLEAGCRSAIYWLDDVTADFGEDAPALVSSLGLARADWDSAGDLIRDILKVGAGLTGERGRRPDAAVHRVDG